MANISFFALALVIDPRDAGIPFTESPGSTYVFWFGDYRVSKVSEP